LGGEQVVLRSLVEVRRNGRVVHHGAELVLRAQKVPSALAGYGPTWTLTPWLLMAQMEAMFEFRYTDETDQLAEDGCMIHCDAHPVPRVVVPAVQYRCRDIPAVEVNHEICRDNFEEGEEGEEEIDGKAGILYDIVGMAQVGYRIDCVEDNPESEAQIQLS
jgi:hypothetical protein